MTSSSEITVDLDDGSGAAIECFVARPSGQPIGAVIVIHEVWGIQEQTRSIARRLAGDGFIAIAPDVLSEIGVDETAGADLERLRFHATDEERHREQQRLRDLFSAAFAPEYTAWAVSALSKVVDAALAMDGIEGRVAVTGFCFGGSLAWQLVAADERVLAAIPFYGRGPDRSALDRIRVPVLAIYGGLDQPLMDDLPRLTADAEAAGVVMETVVYPDAEHAFFNDLNPAVHDADAAADAYVRLVAQLELVFAAV